jgi:hypothetical protein
MIDEARVRQAIDLSIQEHNRLIQSFIDDMKQRIPQREPAPPYVPVNDLERGIKAHEPIDLDSFWEMTDSVDAMMRKHTHSYKQILELRYNRDGSKARSVSEIAKILGIRRSEQIYEMIDRAGWLIKHELWLHKRNVS